MEKKDKAIFSNYMIMEARNPEKSKNTLFQLLWVGEFMRIAGYKVIV